MSYNERAIEEISKRLQLRDFLCLVIGPSSRPVIDAFPQCLSVEYAVGYAEIASLYRVYPSQAHRHWIAGKYSLTPSYYDEVIPHAFDPALFPTVQAPEDYYLFVGRLLSTKGLHIAVDACKKLNKKLLIVGQGATSWGDGWLKTEDGQCYQGNIEYLGTKGFAERNALMAGAKALLCLSQYHEPFGMVSVEANLCGCPVITPDWGAFTEIVENGVNGWRTRNFKEIMEAADRAPRLNRTLIKSNAEALYSTEIVCYQYQNYFERLSTLWDKGWYST